MNIGTEKKPEFSPVNSERRVRTAVARQICKPCANKVELLFVPSPPLSFFLNVSELEITNYSPFKTAGRLP